MIRLHSSGRKTYKEKGKKMGDGKTPLMAIAVGFWDAFGEWTPNTPAIMAKVALMALEREGFEIVKKSQK